MAKNSHRRATGSDLPECWGMIPDRMELNCTNLWTWWPRNAVFFTVPGMEEACGECYAHSNAFT